MSSKRIAERVEIHLKYEGLDVDSGTMAGAWYADPWV